MWAILEKSRATGDVRVLTYHDTQVEALLEMERLMDIWGEDRAYKVVERD